MRAPTATPAIAPALCANLNIMQKKRRRKRKRGISLLLNIGYTKPTYALELFGTLVLSVPLDRTMLTVVTPP